MITYLAAAIAGLVAANPVEMVCIRDLQAARDRWLLLVLAGATLWLGWVGQYWLACMGLWHLCTWRNETMHRTLLLWMAIGTAWMLALQIPSWAWSWVAGIWLVMGAVDVGSSYYRWKVLDWSEIKRPRLGNRSKGKLGSPVLSGQFLAALAPFCPWWGWPVLAAGLYTTFSYTAFLGIAIGMAWLYPAATWWIAGGLAMIFVTLWVSKR